MECLKIEQVSYQYRGKYQTVRAVNGVSYSFQAGRFYAIVGKSGSGKTTLLSLLAGLDVPTEGTVLANGVSTKDCNRNALRRDHISVIYQNYNLFPLLTVEENVMYPLRLKKTDKETARAKAHETLRAVDLPESYFKRLPSRLSGGEQQRVAIARTLAAGSEIILADEPTGNLDETNTQNIVHILASLAHDQNRCVIVVTHDTDIAAQADEVLQMRDGALVREESVI